MIRIVVKMTMMEKVMSVVTMMIMMMMTISPAPLAGLPLKANPTAAAAREA